MTSLSLSTAFSTTFNPTVIHIEDIVTHDVELFEALCKVVGRDDTIRFIMDKVSIDQHHEIEALIVNVFAHRDVLTTYARIDEMLLRAKAHRTKTVI